MNRTLICTTLISSRLLCSLSLMRVYSCIYRRVCDRLSGMVVKLHKKSLYGLKLASKK